MARKIKKGEQMNTAYFPSDVEKDVLILLEQFEKEFHFKPSVADAYRMLIREGVQSYKRKRSNEKKRKEGTE